MKKIKKYIILLTCCLLFTACVEGKGSQSENVISGNEQQSEYTVDLKQEGEYMVIETQYGEIRYPYAFFDIIAVKKVERDGVLELKFDFETEDCSEEMYVLTIGTENGTKIGAVKDTDIFVHVYEQKTKLNDDNQKSFFAAQETVNDVIASVYQWENFTETK